MNRGGNLVSPTQVLALAGQGEAQVVVQRGQVQNGRPVGAKKFGKVRRERTTGFPVVCCFFGFTGEFGLVGRMQFIYM